MNATVMRMSGFGDIYCAGSVAQSLKEQKGIKFIKGIFRESHKGLAEYLPIFNKIEYVPTLNMDLIKKISIGEIYHPQYTYKSEHIVSQMCKPFNLKPILNYKGFELSDSVPKNKIVLNTICGNYFETKKYPYWDEIKKYLFNKYPNDIIELGSHDIPFHVQCQILCQAKCLIGHVSLFSHIAGHYGIKGIVINSGLEDNILAGYDSIKQIQSNIECSPCYLMKCNQTPKHKCHDLIRPIVLNEIKSFLGTF